jgi:hypothetical protein
MDEVAEAEAQLSPGWWQSRSSAQLHDMARGGLAAGELGAGAHREIERRARECARAQKKEAEHRAERVKGIRISVLGGLEIAMLLALGAMLVRG